MTCVRYIIRITIFLMCFGHILMVNAQSQEELWVDSVMQTLTLDQRIGQLFMIRAHSNLGQDHVREVERQIREFEVGGLCFFQGTPEGHTRLINHYQELSSTLPLMIGMDAEWGLGMRFKDGVIDYPRALMLGAIQDNSLLYDYGTEIARQLRRIGVHINFAPVVDVNNNPENPVINFRSFGEDKYNVSTKGYMYMRGMQDHHVAACAKHFPGHGDTDTDSHHALPVINHSKQRLEDIELFPFRTLVNHDVASIMMAHLNIPALAGDDSIPTSLSSRVINQLLRRDMGYDGLVFTDALEMKAVSDNYENGALEVTALQAGNDMLLLPNNIDRAFAAIRESITTGELDTTLIFQSVRRILRAKYRMQLHEYKPASEYGVKLDLNNSQALSLKYKLVENALTLVRNSDDLIPFLDQDINMGSLSIGAGGLSHFQVMAHEYRDIPRHISPGVITPVQKTELLHEIGQYDVVLLSLHGMSQYAYNNFGLDESVVDFVNALSAKTNVVLLIFGNPYSLKYFDEVDHVVVAYDDDRLTQNLTAQALFGATGFKGRLPVTASDRSTYGTGIDTRAHFRIGFSVPERVGLHMDSVKQVDRIIHELINRRAAPGAQLLVAKDGMVVYQKEYGYQTYEKDRPIQRDQIYDLASVTKTTASTVAIMKLFDEGKVDLKTPISSYLPELTGTNKADMTLERIMTHQAGLKSWIPFYRKTLSPSTRRPSGPYYHEEPDDVYNIKVTNDLYLRSDYRDSIWQLIIDSEVNPDRHYVYSDLGFYLIARIVENLSGLTLDQYVQKHFYEPLHMPHTTFNPLDKISRQDIVPTEKDNYFRYTDLRGYVHDMGAAMLSGVSGHAGLFSNTSDLIKIYQMLLNEGSYGGRQYFSPETVRVFTSRPSFSMRRGVGFDMKQVDPDKSCNISELASESTFGHYGFTGTCVWVDPQYDLVYIFLSNRTYPTMRNNLLGKEDYRSKIQTAIYKSFLPKFVQNQS